MNRREGDNQTTKDREFYGFAPPKVDSDDLDIGMVVMTEDGPLQLTSELMLDGYISGYGSIRHMTAEDWTDWQYKQWKTLKSLRQGES